MLHQQRPRPGHRIAPGLALCGIGAAASLAATAGFPAVSPLLVAIVLGVLLGNLVTLPEALAPGIAVAARVLLRLGIVVLGLKLTLSDVASLGPGMIVTVVAVVTVGILSTCWLGRRLGLSRSQSLLIACGFSICGAAAVGALEGVLDADEEEVVTAVGLVVAFGTAMIPLVPLVGAALGLSTETTALWAGASVHEVAQVVAIGGTLGGAALGLAVISKLARVLLLAPVMVVVSLRMRRDGKSVGKRPPLVPLFVVGFLAMVLVRSTGIVPAPVVDAASWMQTALLTAAMFALGTGAKIRAFAKLGPRPFLLAGAATSVVAVIALTGAVLSS